MAEMKDSGIEWCGKIPIIWNVMPNKYVMHKKKEICPKYNGEDILSLTMDGVIVRDLDAGGKMPASFDGYQRVHPHNLLMCLFDYDVTPRCIGLIQNEGLTSPAYSQFVMKNGNDARYYYYYYLMIDNTKELLHLAKNLRHSFTEDQLGIINTPVPPVEIQKQIAKYLDQKCEDIDAVYVEIEKQIETLEEYKKSIITEAVTKGLNPDVEMKDSGIEWMGMVPSTWESNKVLNCIDFIGGSQPPLSYFEGEEKEGYVRLIQNRDYKTDDYMTFVPKRMVTKFCEVDDVMIGRYGPPLFVLHRGLKGAYNVAIMKAVPKLLDREFMAFYLQNYTLLQYIESFSKRTAGQAGVNTDILKKYPIYVPPMEEQKKIAIYLEKKCIEIDNVIGKKKEQLETLEQYKKSLIYEYVTGKKEVQDYE